MYFVTTKRNKSFPASQQTHCLCITKTRLIIPSQEIIPLYSMNRTKHLNTVCGQTAGLVSGNCCGWVWF